MLDVTDNTFEKEVLQAEGTVIADFWAPWCGPCRKLGPVLESLDKKHGSEIKFVKVNVDEQQQFAGRYGIQSIPALLVFKNGELVDRQLGFVPEPVLETYIQTLKGAR